MMNDAIETYTLEEIRKLKQDMNELYMYVNSVKEKNKAFMDRVVTVFICFLLLAVSSFVVGLLYSFWSWVLQ